MSGDSFFQKVATRADRERVYNILVERKVEVVAVTESKSSHKYVPKYLSGHKMVMSPPDKVTVPFPNGPVVVTFSIGVEKYFLKTQLEEGRGEDVSLDMQAELYKLQRRNSFRLNIPSGYQARIEITVRNEKPVKEKYELVDLSGGGFAFELPAGHEPQFKKDEILIGRLVVGPEFKEVVTCIVRHARMVGSRGSGLCRVGAEFQSIKAPVQNELIKLVMDLHRDMFSKFKLGTH